MMFKQYDQIIKPEYCDKIFAHTSSDKNPEMLIEHSEMTLKYCDHLIDKLSLKDIFDNVLSKLLGTSTSNIVELIRSIVYYHDLGKINPVFQREKMQNNLGVSTNALNSFHSFYGKILFDHLFYDDFKRQFPKQKHTVLFFLLSQVIDRHHTPLRDINYLYEKLSADNTDNIIRQELDDLDTVCNIFFNKHSKVPNIENFCNAYNFKNKHDNDIRKIFETEEKQEALFYLYKITYSLLITSDYYATGHYVQDISYLDKIYTVTPNLINKCETNFYNYDFNKNLSSFTNYKSTQNSNICELNSLRTAILLESDDKLNDAILKNPEQRVFYLNAPTGGGKTNISLKLALSLLKSKKNIKKVFYVFPFINLIEQNYDVIKKTFCLDEELSSVYSSSSWSNESEEEKERVSYVLDNDFLNHPFVVMSNVNFFNTFLKSRRSNNYRLINLANSIVIIDEIQSLNDKSWTLFNDLIMYGSKYLNIHFIIMSATLPKLDTLSDNKNNLALDLIDSKKYFNHPLFQNRVNIEYKDDVNDLDNLLSVLHDNIDEKMNKILLVVNTIHTSLELYQKIKKDKKISSMGFHAYLLNSTFLSHRQKLIIEKMKGCKKSILISTQSVEAGMDIDCDFGIRDFAIFDSIEQIAGRINRNSKKPNHTAKLIIVNLKKNDIRQADFVYRDSHRWNTINKNNFKLPKDIDNFLKTRNFDDYYDKVLNNIKSIDNDDYRISALFIAKKGIRHLNFDELNKVNIIEQDTISLIVDARVSKKYFSNTELNFIGNKNGHQDTISGQSIWAKYNKFTKNFQGGHVERKINTKIWTSIISKFTVNIKNSHGNTKLSEILNLEHGIHLLKNQYYSDEEGIDRNQLDKNSFLTPN